MDFGYKLKLENPIKEANILSKLFFGWTIDVVKKGANKVLTMSDLYKTMDADKSKCLGDSLEKHWEDELRRAQLKQVEPNLMRALSKTFLFDYMMWGLLYFVHFVVFRSTQPVILSMLIALFSADNSQEKRLEMYLMSTLLIVIAVVIVFLFHHHNFGLSKIGMRIRVALSSLTYRKLTKLSQKALTETTAGQVVNLLSNDLNRFDQVVLYLHAIWALPFQVILISYFLWREVQISCLVGIISMVIISVPGQGYLGKIIGRLRYRIAQKTDRRVKLMNEVITGIQVIKMYAWEKSFEKVIKTARLDEIRDLTSTSYVRGVLNSCNIFIDRSTLFLTIVCYVLLGNTISAAKVFSMAQFFNNLQLTLAIFYPMAVRFGAETIISVKRLREFLVLEERPKPEIFHEQNDHGVTLSNVSASWTTSDDLKNLNLHVPQGSLCAIVGAVGAGKSSILQVILGELPLKSGNLSLGGEVSYASQDPWLFQSTVRNNILFGQQFKESWYDKVVRICALERDFDQFPQRDQTIVGERGVSLSGGQRARINLARAIYRDADIYLLDDPLSAVDTHVGRHLFDECIVRHLRGKTRILVTHQLQYLKKADLLVVVDDGKILAQGTYEELQKSDIDFTKLLISTEDDDEKTDEHGAKNRSRLSKTASIRSRKSCIDDDEMDCDNVEEGNEEVRVSQENKSTLWAYFKATKSTFLVVSMVLSLVIAQALCAAVDFWVAFWTKQEHMREQSTHQSYGFIANISGTTTDSPSAMFDSVQSDGTTHHLVKTNYSIYFYAILLIAAVIITLVRSFLFFKVCMLSSINLHSNMFHALLKAPMRFFDTNPSGRVLNRFSKDMGAIDEILPEALLSALAVFLVMLGVLVNVAISNVYSIIAMVILGALFFKMGSWFISSAKVIKHLEGSAKSPVFSHVSSTLKGITTIRASKATEELICQFDNHQDVHTSAWYLTITFASSFGLWIDIICISFIAIVTFSSVYLQTTSLIDSSLLGLAISQSLILAGMAQQGIRFGAETVNQLTSVERVLQYSALEIEGQSETPEKLRPSGRWPSEGRLQIKNLYLRYVKDDPPVLKNLNFTVQPGKKIGIVGRTGAGKSSLITALFRLAPIEGTISIDGVDTELLGLSDLRKKISIIPQEPVLFSTTVRDNLDPFREFEDSKLWDALEQVELKESVDSLDFLVTEGGSNFSLGQRQLICLARAILRNNKILVLDEATANVDQRTDAFIQATIRDKFADCTVLTIAHRLNTIMDCDKVLVMSFGVIVEFDHPFELLQIPNGIFRNMVLETGTTMSELLEGVAKEAYSNNVEFNTAL